MLGGLVAALLADPPPPPPLQPVCWGFGFIDSEKHILPGHPPRCDRPNDPGTVTGCGTCNFNDPAWGTGTTDCPGNSSHLYPTMEDCLAKNCGSTTGTVDQAVFTCVHGTCGQPANESCPCTYYPPGWTHWDTCACPSQCICEPGWTGPNCTETRPDEYLCDLTIPNPTCRVVPGGTPGSVANQTACDASCHPTPPPPPPQACICLGAYPPTCTKFPIGTPHSTDCPTCYSTCH